MVKNNEDLVDKFLSLPSYGSVSDSEYDKQLRHMVNYMSQLSPSKLVAGTSSGDDYLDLLDPSAQTIPYLFILQAHIQNSKTKAKSTTQASSSLSGGALWQRIADFLQEFDPIQIRYASTDFRSLLDIFLSVADTSSTPSAFITPLRESIFRLDPSASTLTSTHLTFVRACLRARCYAEALPVIDFRIYHVPSTSDKGSLSRSNQLHSIEEGASSPNLNANPDLSGRLSYRDYLEYFIYSGLIYVGLKQWENALFCFEVALTVPTTGPLSMLMSEAYKRWLLVGLLSKGKPPEIPKALSNVVIKPLKAVTKPYEALVDTFRLGDPDRLRAEIQEAASIWEADCNTGLVHEVFNAQRVFAIFKLEDIFTACSIKEVARRTSPDPNNLVETREFIEKLITSDRLKATLTTSGPDTILRFLTPQNLTKSEKELQLELDIQKSDLAEILKHIQGDDQRLEISKDYIEHLRKLKKQSDAGAYSPGSKSGPSGDLAEYEEDVMNDIP